MATAIPEGQNGSILDVLRQIDERLRRLEDAVAQLKASTPAPEPQKPWWEQIAGTWKDNPFCEEWAREIRRLRREDYARVNAEIDAAEAKEKKKKRKSRRTRG